MQPESWSKYWWENVKKEEPTDCWLAQMFITPEDEKIFLPKDTSWLIVTAPANVQIIVYGDGSELHPVDAEKEDEKISVISGGAESLENISARTGYDQFAFMSPRYERTFAFTVDSTETDNEKYEVFKNTSFHLVGVYKNGLKAGQRVMEYYVKNTENDYPSPSKKKSPVVLYGDYPDDVVDWYVSVIGDNYTEFFIKFNIDTTPTS
jgi:hypothetical protein